MIKHFINASELFNQAIHEANKSSVSQIKKVIEEIDRDKIPVPQSVVMKLISIMAKKMSDDNTNGD